MMRVAFTGAATDGLGRPILRADLTEAAERAGHVVLRNWQQGVELLVASRVDTNKARRAAERGVPVVSYEQFLAQYHLRPTFAQHSRRQPDLWTDTHPKSKPVLGTIDDIGDWL